MGTMTKRITISVPDELYNKLTQLKEEFSDWKLRDKKILRTISSICQAALTESLKELEVSHAYRKEGIDDGFRLADSLAERDQKYILKVMSGEGPYKKWSRSEKITELTDHFQSGRNIDPFAPKFFDLCEGKIILDDWVNKDKDTLYPEDKRYEMGWSYMEGCFEGIAKAITKNNNKFEV